MSVWILLVYLTGYQSIAVDHIKFDTKAQCYEAKAKLETAYKGRKGMFRNTFTKCVKVVD